MKSVSWLLYESESSVLRECQACGFSTRSPSIYRRHSRHCVVGSSVAQGSRGTAFPSISCNLSAEFPKDHSELAADVSSKPSAEFPYVSCASCVDVSDVSSQLLVSDELFVAERTDSLDVGSDSVDHGSEALDHSSDENVRCSARESNVSGNAEDDRTAVKPSSSEVDQLTSSELLSASLLSSSTSTPATSDLQLNHELLSPRHDESLTPRHHESLTPRHDESLTPRHDESLSPRHESLTPRHDESLSPRHESLTPRHDESLSPRRDAVLNSVSETEAAKIDCDLMNDLSSVNCVNERFNDGDDVLSLKHDTSDSVSYKTDCSRPGVTDMSHSVSTQDINDDNACVDSSQTHGRFENVTELSAAENNVTAGESRVGTSPDSSGADICTVSKKYPRSRKSSSPSKRRCNHCTAVLSSRLERRTHMQTKHPDKIPVFRCTDCNYSSIEHKNYERHLLRHLLTGPFHCDQCSFSSTSLSSVKRHVSLQHSSQSDTATENVSISHVPPKESEISSTVSEVSTTDSSPVVDSAVGGNSVSLPSGVTSGAGLPADSDNCDSVKSQDSNDGEASASHSRDGSDKSENFEAKAEVSDAASEETAVPDTDTSEDVITVEVKICAGEDGTDETWWTCLACGARYNERAKVRRHVKCKHHIPLSKCRLHDLRGIPHTENTSDYSSAADDLIQKLHEARSLAKALDCELPATSKQKNVKTKGRGSLRSGGTKLQPKSFVKIAPKPLQLDDSCQIFAAPATVINSKRQVVLPKCNWKQMSFSLPPANFPPESSTTASDLDAGTCESGSELKRHLTEMPAGDKELSSAVVQEVTRKEPENDVSLNLTAVTQDVPRKKRRLILRPKAKILLEPSSTVVCESSDAVKETSSDLVCADILPLEQVSNVDIKECSSEVEDMASGESVIKVSESNDDQVKKTSETKQRQVGVKRTSPLKCAHCQFTSFRLPDLRRHLLEHTGDKVYECGRCCRSFRNKIGLYLHEQRKHKADTTQLSDTSQVDDNAQTTMDTEQSSAETQKVDGNSGGPKKKKKRIRESSLGDRLKRKLNETSASEVDTLAIDESGVKKVVSEDTGEKSGDKKERSGSRRCRETVEMVQSTDKSDHFKIVIRRRSSSGEEILETIAGVNNGMMCRFCGYMAKIPVQLTQHMKIHTGERDYWCTIGNCSYGTIWRCDMKRHLRKFHADEVERRGGNYYELLQRSYQPNKLKDKTDPSLCVESSSSTVSVIKMTKRQRRRLIKLQNNEHSELTEKEIPHENKSEEGDNSIFSTSEVTGDTSEPASAAESEAKKDNFTMKSTERFRPYKCSECGRRSNWRWDLKKHIQAAHKNAVIIKLTDDVARATFSDIYSSRGGRNGIRFPRRHGLSDASLLKGKSEPNFPRNSQTGESGTDPDGKKPMSELERALARAPAPVKSIGMIDKLRLKRFQCSACPYRSNHRGDLGRHIRMRHGRGNCTISVLGAEVAAATLRAYRLQWNRKKAWLPNADSLRLRQTGKMDSLKMLQKFHRGSRSAEQDTKDKVCESAEGSEMIATESETVNEDGSKKQRYKDFWYVNDGEDETKCCDMCPFKTDRTGLLELHKLRHRAPAAGTSASSVTFSCPHCPYFVRTSRQLERHMALHEDAVQLHNEPLLNNAAVQHTSSCCPAKNRYVCEKCPFVSMFRNEFWLHRRHHFVPKVRVPYSCDLCPFWASDRRALSEHSSLHTQSYYPHLSVRVVSRYRPATVDNNDHRTCGDRSVAVRTGSLAHVVAEVVNDMQSKKDTSSDDEMEVESCPQLEAVGDLMTAVSEAEVPDCCPLLEPEYDQSSCQPSHLGYSITCPAVSTETAMLTSSCSAVANSTTPDNGEVSQSDNDTVALDDGIPSTVCSCSTDLKTEAPKARLSAEFVVSSVAVSVVPSDGDGVSLDDDRMSAVDHTDSTQVSQSQPVDCCPTKCVESAILTASSSAVGGSVTSDSDAVSLTANRADVDDRTVTADCTDSVQLHLKAERLSCQTRESVSARVNNPTEELQVDVDNKEALCGSMDVTDYIQSTDEDGRMVSSCQSPDALRSAVSDGTQALDAEGRCDDDVSVKDNSDASGDNRPAAAAAAELTDSGPLLLGSEISNDQIPDVSSVDASSREVELKADGTCVCALQCPYCFFAIASVRLLRQHIVFHVAMSDAVGTPVFDPQLDAVEDGRMDDDRCLHLVQLCHRCRESAADLQHPVTVSVPDTSDACVVSGNVGLGNTNQVNMSVLDDKAAFLSGLSLYVS